MELDYNKIFQYVYINFNISNKIIFDDIIYQALKMTHYKGKDESEIIDHLTSVKNNITRRVNEEIKHKESKGKIPRFYIDENNDYLVGSALIEKADDQESIKNKNNLLRAYYIEKLLLNMDDGEFERLCALVLSEIGCSNYDVTRKTADSGIDFYGTVMMSNNKMFFDKDLFKENEKLHLIGQAKRYSRNNPIKPKEIREFIGSILILNFTQGWGIEDKLNIKNLPKKYLRPNEPIISLFITSSYFTLNTINLCRELGVFIKNGEDLSLWLSENVFENIDIEEIEIKNFLFQYINSTIDNFV